MALLEIMIGVCFLLIFLLVIMLFVAAFTSPPKRNSRKVRDDVQRIKDQINKE